MSLDSLQVPFSVEEKGYGVGLSREPANSLTVESSSPHAKVHIHVHVYTCIYNYIYMCIHVCTCIYIYIRIHVHVHCLYTNALVSMSGLTSGNELFSPDKVTLCLMTPSLNCTYVYTCMYMYMYVLVFECF